MEDTKQQIRDMIAAMTSELAGVVRDDLEGLNTSVAAEICSTIRDLSATLETLTRLDSAQQPRRLAPAPYVPAKAGV